MDGLSEVLEVLLNFIFCNPTEIFERLSECVCGCDSWSRECTQSYFGSGSAFSCFGRAAWGILSGRIVNRHFAVGARPWLKCQGSSVTLGDPDRPLPSVMAVGCQNSLAEVFVWRKSVLQSKCSEISCFVRGVHLIWTYTLFERSIFGMRVAV